MVLRGGIRGNGKQLARYLVTQGENEHIEILEVNGRTHANSQYLYDMLSDWQSLSELSKSDKGLYHAVINPAYVEDKHTDWQRAADILAEQLGFNDQPRAIVLHEKKGKLHGHVVWQRYDVANEKLVDNTYSRYAQDRARKVMEREFNHTPTAHRNPHRPELKIAMTELWKKTKTGKEFLAEVRKSGYMIAAGSGRNPYVVVDENGHSFNLPRYITGVNVKPIRERLRHETMLGEKEAIIEMRRLKETGGNSGKSGKAQSDTTTQTHARKMAFIENTFDIAAKPQAPKEREELKQEFKQNATDTTQEIQDKNKLVKDFALNRNEAMQSQAEKEQRKKRLLEEQKRIEERKRNRKGKHLSIAIAFMIRLFMGNAQPITPHEPIKQIHYLWDKTAIDRMHSKTINTPKKSIAYVIG